MKRIIYTVFAIVMAEFSVVAQQAKVIEKIIETGKSDNRTMDHLDVLCNRFGGRPIGSSAYEYSAGWCASQFRSWGMDVIMDEAGSVPVGFDRGPWFGRLLGDEPMDLHFATPSYTSGTKGVQRGPVVLEPKSQEEFNRMKGTLKGAWVLVSGTSTGWPIDFSEKADSARAVIIAENEEISKQNREIMRYNWENRDKPQKETVPLKEEPALFYRQMREAGILGVIQSAKVPITALYDRKNLDKMTFENLPTVCDIKLDENQFKVLEQMVKEHRYFLLEFDIRNHFRPGPVKYHNVIGVIKGSKYTDEYVMMGGHLDAYDVATGGVDDGSGITPVMEAARLIMAAGGKPKRTILVCLWAGEEFGLLGSKNWVEENGDKLDKISNYFNRDGGPTVANSITVPQAMYDDMQKICEPLNSINPEFPFALKLQNGTARPKPKTAGGSDHAYFAMNGVPTINIGSEDSKGYNFNYGEIWHTENDLYTKSIPEYQNHTSIVYAVIVYGVANLDHLLSRDGVYGQEPEKAAAEKSSK